MEDPLEEGLATHSSILTWRIPKTEEPGGLQSMGPHRVRHDLAHMQASLLNMSRQLRLTRHLRKACHVKNEHQEHTHKQDN